MAIFAITGVCTAGDVDAQAPGDLNYSITVAKTNFSVADAPYLNTFTAVKGSPSPYLADNFTWKVHNRQLDKYVFDNTTSGTQMSDTYTFTDPGIYAVSLIAYNATVGSQSPKEVIVTAYDNISGNFTWGPTGTDYQVNFTYFPDSGSPLPNSYEWKYDNALPNASPTSSRTVFYTFPAAGNYVSTVTARNTTVSFISENSSQQVVTVKAPPVADFWITDNYTQAPIPFTATIHNNSTNATAYKWNFGDGNTSTDIDPASDIPKLYSKPGIFTIELNATSDWGWNTTNRTLIAYQNISANYTYTTESCPVFPIDMTFRDNSSGGTADKWFWDFGDNVTSWNETNTTTHQFHNPQDYNVTMRAYNKTFNIFNQTNQTVSVTGLFANFTANPWQKTISRGQNTTVLFNSTTVGNNSKTQYTWDFGNGLKSMYPQTSSVYSRNGTYNVTLTVDNNNIAGCSVSNSTTRQVQIFEHLTADFDYTPKYGSYPLTVQFNDLSEDTPNRWQWDFFEKDGVTINTTILDVRSPTHVYMEPGDYKVVLTTTNANGDTGGPTDKIITLTNGIFADFTANVTRGSYPLTVQFTDNSSPVGTVNTWAWNFGDGQSNVTVQNPVRKFTQGGNYTVTLTVGNSSAGSTDTKQKSQYILVGSPLYANFTPNGTEVVPVNTSMLVKFTDLSAPQSDITSWNWNFDDLLPNDTNKSPYHQFTSEGWHTVTLNVSNLCYGTSSVMRSRINVSVQKSPEASFTFTPEVVDRFKNVSFTSTASPEVNKWDWDFGDGSYSTDPNPSHQYEYAGMYTVTLTATNPYGNGSVSHIVRVKGPVDAEFVTDPSGYWGVINQPITFVDTSKGQPIHWTWNFGDGNSTTTDSSSIPHTYTSPQWITVNMTGTNWDGQSDSASHQIQIEDKSRPRDVNFGAIGMKYAGTHPLTVQFEDYTPTQSNVTSWLWEFGDGSNSFNTTPSAPKHKYNDPGEYSVTLTVRNEMGVNEKTRVAYVTVV
ncbi:MAG: PKD domain-containing protein [Methanospirillum sp.]|nr:PKD domain-containing protein [Methanospirillum sp.]